MNFIVARGDESAAACPVLAAYAILPGLEQEGWVARRAVSIATIAALALAGCGGGHNTAKISPNWDSRATATAQQLANKIARSFKGQCADFGFINRVMYVTNAKKIHSAVPLATGACNALTESIEISVFPTAAARAHFVQQRADILCRRSIKARAGLPGLHWVVADNWSMQPDSEGVSREIANALRAKYQLTACKGQGQVDWDDVDVAHVDQLATTLQKAGIGCRDFVLQDRELLSHNPHYVQAGLPGAYGKCTVGDDPNVLITSYRSPNATPIGQFLPQEQRFVCTNAPTARIVTGEDWAVFVGKGQQAPEIAHALHGKLFGGACPQG
jgi:hypothetical protein